MLRLLSKRLVLQIAEGRSVDFRKRWIYSNLKHQLLKVDYKDFDIGNDYSEDWDRFKVWDHKSITSEPVVKSYSMANYPERKGSVEI